MGPKAALTCQRLRKAEAAGSSPARPTTFWVFWEWLGYMIIPYIFSEGLAVRNLLIEYNFYEELQ